MGLRAQAFVMVTHANAAAARELIIEAAAKVSARLRAVTETSTRDLDQAVQAMRGPAEYCGAGAARRPDAPLALLAFDPDHRLGFQVSSVLGVPLGILCGTSKITGPLVEPFVDFFRYMPAPAFGALTVATLGIYDGPEIAIIVIGTFFHQVLIIANTTRQADRLLVGAALTLGARRLRLLVHVIVSAVLPQLYRDQRIPLGWAWTYLIVAELIGTSSGITFLITQQAAISIFEAVHGAILLFGLAGSLTDIAPAKLGDACFPGIR